MKRDQTTTPIAEEQQRLFPLPPEVPQEPNHNPGEPHEAVGSPRLRTANREQIEFRSCCWNDLLPTDHQACMVWEYVQRLDLSELLSLIKSVEHRPGHPPADPRILTTLWLYATLRGVGAARELARRCETDLPFQWICGGVSMNYHTLAEFRTCHVKFLDDLLTKSVAVLLQQELVTLDRVAQDGMRVRASAGASSFHRQPTLQENLADAEAQLAILKQQLEADPGAVSKRQKAARERAKRERLERVQKALEQLQEVESRKSAAEKDEARVSTTDPEARVMKMANGGFNPAYNVEFATDTQTQIITGVDVLINCDRGQLEPMLEQHEERYEKTPEEVLADGGFVNKAEIASIAGSYPETTLYMPVPKSHNSETDPHVRKDGDTAEVAAWRSRMGTSAAQKIYKDRASTAECVNAIARNRGLQQFRVRGRPKVRAIVLWYVLAHNLMRTVALHAQSQKREV